VSGRSRTEEQGACGDSPICRRTFAAFASGPAAEVDTSFGRARNPPAGTSLSAQALGALRMFSNRRQTSDGRTAMDGVPVFAPDD
jgi:hypothetical protein